MYVSYALPSRFLLLCIPTVESPTNTLCSHLQLTNAEIAVCS